MICSTASSKILFSSTLSQAKFVADLVIDRVEMMTACRAVYGRARRLRPKEKAGRM
jgi:hypothetical protein